MNEKQQNFFDAGWVFTFAFAFIIKISFPDLGGIPALLITLTPMLILLIFLAPGKDAEATKDTQ